MKAEEIMEYIFKHKHTEATVIIKAESKNAAVIILVSIVNNPHNWVFLEPVN